MTIMQNTPQFQQFYSRGVLFCGNPLLLVIWSAISVAVLITDVLTGPEVRFPVVFALPVVLSAWFNGFIPGLLFAFVLPLARVVLFYFVWNVPW
ncbi:MAG TPA: hypothetical protein PLP17_11710, partial [Oligoflexia bacterium]|nr:hypothetical protein [Oligoflexia bacterium]